MSCLLFVLGLPIAGAHQELYHNVDVDLRETNKSGIVGLLFTIHAPELLVGFGEASDAMFDSRWLEGRSDDELERIVALARQYLAHRFEVALDGERPVDLAADLSFQDFDMIRSVETQGLPPACLSASLELVASEGARFLEIEHAESSHKRLMAVLYRPKSFPATIEVEPGAKAVIDLPNAPPEARKAGERAKGVTQPGALYLTVALGGLLVIGFLMWRRIDRRAAG